VANIPGIFQLVSQCFSAPQALFFGWYEALPYLTTCNLLDVNGTLDSVFVYGGADCASHFPVICQVALDPVVAETTTSTETRTVTRAVVAGSVTVAQFTTNLTTFFISNASTALISTSTTVTSTTTACACWYDDDHCDGCGPNKKSTPNKIGQKEGGKGGQLEKNASKYKYVLCPATYGNYVLVQDNDPQGNEPPGAACEAIGFQLANVTNEAYIDGLQQLLTDCGSTSAFFGAWYQFTPVCAGLMPDLVALWTLSGQPCVGAVWTLCWYDSDSLATTSSVATGPSTTLTTTVTETRHRLHFTATPVTLTLTAANSTTTLTTETSYLATSTTTTSTSTVYQTTTVETCCPRSQFRRPRQQQ
jgi:hypothetical protein